MEKSIINKMRQIVKNESENVIKDFTEDKKDLKNYNGSFLWGISNKGTNLICFDSPFSYLQIEAMREDKHVYTFTGGKLRKITPERAKKLTIGIYTRFQRAWVSNRESKQTMIRR